VILYLQSAFSEAQEKQFTTLAKKFTALGGRRNVDDCQRLVKQLSPTPSLNSARSSTSANSINIGRSCRRCFITLPPPPDCRWRPYPDRFRASGNFGNLTAGIFAKTHRLARGEVCCLNHANDVFLSIAQR